MVSTGLVVQRIAGATLPCSIYVRTLPHTYAFLMVNANSSASVLLYLAAFPLPFIPISDVADHFFISDMSDRVVQPIEAH